MKKISTLALALIAMGSLSMPVSAQNSFEAVSTPTLESGWYKMRQVASASRTGISTEAPRFVFSAQDAKVNGSDNYFFGVADAAKTDATAFVYVDNTNGQYAIRNINGKWGNNLAKASDTKPTAYSITQDETTPTQYSVGGYWDDWNHQDANWNYIAGSIQYGKARFEFSKVSDTDLAAYDVYTVEFKGDITTGSVSSEIEANKGTKTVYPGGNFFFTKGTSLKGSDFVATDVTDYRNTITVDKKDKKIVVAYQYAYTLEELKTTANELLSHKGAGYPVEGAAARTTLAQAIVEATSAPELNKAIKAYKDSKTDIQMPEDGKVYVLTNVQQDGTCNHFSYTTGRLTTVKDKTQAAKFVCRVVNDKYVFVNVEDGKYLVVAAMNNAGTNSGKGYITKYDAQWADLTVSKNSLYSCFNIGGKRTGSATEGNFIVKKNGSFESYGLKELNTAEHTTAFKLEEVSYPNTITFNTVSDVEGVSNLATFSAPFATVIPSGVKAYYVSTADNTKATMKAVEGEAIPANEGVLLTSESADAVTMVPVTDETLATITDNKLGNSAGAAKTIAEGDNVYILAKGTDGTAFYKGKANTTLGMNKAYLALNGAAGQAISMNFGGNVTGINQIVNAEQNNAPVYDLTGRRVVRTVKGGLYIKGGNKFIAR